MISLYRLAAAFAAASMAASLSAQQPAPAPMRPPMQAPNLMDGAGAAEVTTLTAKIEAVDQMNRTVMVKGPMGHVVTLKVDPKVRNFAQIRVGDEIVLKYIAAISFKLEKTGGRSETVTTTGPATAPPGMKPGTAMEQQTVIVANIQSLDVKRQEILLEGPHGRYVEVKVRDPDVFKAMKVGDKVESTYSEAVVIDLVTPAAPKS